MASQSETTGTPAVAVVGMGCRFPGARGVDEFWELLKGNRDAITPIPRDRFDVGPHYDEEPGVPGRTVQRHGGFLDGLYGFDAAFFRVSPREARTMDPQQRLLLQVAWEALEDAGIRPSSLAGSRSGVFVGQANSEYAEAAGEAAAADVRAMAGGRLRAVTAGRLSYALDLRGPSVVVDTACSSSLAAVHAARQSLVTGESDLGIAAGVNVLLSPADSIAYSQGGMLSPGGRCKFGSADADGFVRSEGIAAVVLKRLPDAVRDGDPVLAVLLGSAVVNDGQGSGLLLQPAVPGQLEMLRAACRSAGIAPSRLDYVEAHGTGTVVGDGVELRALAEFYGAEGPPSRPLLVGSVKSNIGHTEAAAGLAGLIKAVLTLRHRTVPASLHCTPPHDLLRDGDLPVRVVSRNTPLAPDGRPAVVGVSSFGISGTNAHVVLGEYVPEESGSPSEPEAGGSAPATASDGVPRLLVLSARSERSVRALAARYATHLEPGGQGHGLALADVCRAAATRRDVHPYRLWAVGATHAEIAEVLRTLAEGGESPHGGVGRADFAGDREAVFVFPGQGAQWPGMGRDLLRSSPAFRAALEACDAAVRDELGWSVIALLTDEDAGLPDTVDKVQPTLWAVQVALAALWRDLGVEPALCLGHSMGEVAAAQVSGALSLRAAAAVICRRSTLMQRLAGRGAMLSVALPAAEAGDLLAEYGEEVCVAADNGPEATVLAGDAATLDRIRERLDAQGVFCRNVRVNVASHSPLMDEIRDDLLAALRTLRAKAPDTPMFSTTRCEPVGDAALDAGYWQENLRQPVRFREAVEAAAKPGDRVFLEVSPHPVLVQAVRDVEAAAGLPETGVPTLLREQDGPAAVVRAAGRAFTLGVRVDWDRFFDSFSESQLPGDRPSGVVHRPARPVPLPLYAWDEEIFRVEPDTRPQRTDGAAGSAVHAFTRDIRLSRLGLAEPGCAPDVRGLRPVPPVVYFGAVLDVARDVLTDDEVTLEQIRFGTSAPQLPEAMDAVARVTLASGGAPGLHRFTVGAAPRSVPPGPEDADGTGPWMTGLLRTPSSRAGAEGAGVAGGRCPGARAELDLALTRCTEYVPGVEFYRRAEARGYRIDDLLRTVDQVWRRDGEAVARVAAPRTTAIGAVEAALLPVMAAWPHSGGVDTATCVYVAESFERVRLAGPFDGALWSVARFTPRPAPEPDGGAAPRGRADIQLVTPEGRVAAEFHGVEMRRLPGAEWVGESAGEPSREPAEDPAPRPGPKSRRTVTVLDHAAFVLGSAVSRIDPRLSLRELGLDSLMALQLRGRLRASHGTEVAVQRLLGKESVADLTAALEGGESDVSPAV